MALFFLGRYNVVIVLALGVSQLWRVYSETFRADYRGDSKISVYQWMACFAVIAVLAAPFALPPSALQPELSRGLDAVWSPAAILLLQSIWLALFVYMGRSMQTGAALQYHVRADRI